MAQTTSNGVKLSVIIPTHNEEQRIAKTLQAVGAYLKNQNYSSEIIIVDSSSHDHTGEIVKKLEATKAQNLRLIVQENLGKGGAVKRGVVEAKGGYILYMDADNATPISEIEKFWPYLNSGIEVVIGDRYLDRHNRVEQPLVRTILSRASNLLIQIVLIPHINDTQAGFKVFKAAAAKEIFKHLTIYGWAFDMELLAIALKLSYRIKAVPIIRIEQGGSTVPPKAFLEALRDLFIIKWRALSGKYSTK